MFGLFYGCIQYSLRKPEYYVLIIGLDNAGKTTFLEKTKSLFIQSYDALEPDSIAPTVGLNIGRMETRHCKITFWDLGGQEGLRTIWERYFPDADAIIYVVDTGDAERLYEAKAAFEHVMHNKKLDGLPVLVVANKQDLPHTQNITTIFDPATQPSLHPFRIQAVCALTGEGVKEGIEWLVGSIKPREHE